MIVDWVADLRWEPRDSGQASRRKAAPTVRHRCRPKFRTQVGDLGDNSQSAGFGRFGRFDKLTAGRLTAGDPALQLHSGTDPQVRPTDENWPGFSFDFPPPRGGLRSLSVGADCIATESRSFSERLCQARQTPSDSDRIEPASRSAAGGAREFHWRRRLLLRAGLGVQAE